MDKPQSIFRVHRDSRERFTLLDNRAIRDKRISFKATGILAFLLSLPDDWEVNIEHMRTVKPDGRDSVRAGFGELVETGYVRKEIIRGAGGKIATTIWHVYESPAPEAGFPTSVQPEAGFPTSENPTQRKTQGNEQPTTTNEFPLTPDGGGDSSIKSKEEGFTEFWAAYPNKKKKDTALRAWKRKGCAAIREEIMLALTMQKGWASWLKGKPPGQFIPHPASWLNGKSWEDEESNPAPAATPATKKGF